MKNYRGNWLVVGVLSLVALFTGCTKPSATSSNNAADGITQYQNPTVACQVNQGSANLLSVNNLTQASNYGQPPSAPAQISINCAGSKSNAPGARLTLSYSLNGGPYTVFNNGLQDSSDLALNFSTPGVKTFTLQASDSAGLVTSVSFSLPVSCNPTNYPAVSGPTGLSVVQGASGPGYNNVAFSGSASGGGGGPYQYAIDLNGDGSGLGRFDYYTAPNSSTPVYWNTSASWQNIYNFYSGSRNIYVQVFDTSCAFMSTFTYPYNWSTGVLSGAQTGATAQTEPYYYLQGNVASLSNSSDAAETVTPFDARDEGLNSNYMHVICNWADNATSGSNPQGVFNIQATNLYSDGNQNDSSQLTESMTLAWSIPDGTQNLSATVPLTGMTYQTSASPDGGFNQYSYNMNSSCTATVQVVRQSSPTTCTANSPSSGYSWPNATITGTYSCPNLSSVNAAQSRSIGVTKGYFYCQTGPGNNCVGGGQEGGTPPTPF